jgi:hypothetical protein
MLVGSNVFFKGIVGFTSKDTDILELVDIPTSFRIVRQIKFPTKCVFQWKRMSPREFIITTLKRNIPMEIGKFLVPEFCKEIGFTIEHLKQLEPLVEKLDEKHKYEEVIFNAYIDNNGFSLTNEQLQQAFKCYELSRQNNKNE